MRLNFDPSHVFLFRIYYKKPLYARKLSVYPAKMLSEKFGFNILRKLKFSFIE